MQLSGDDHTLLETLKTEIANVNATRIGVAVSGGGDSIALLLLLAALSADSNITVEAITVDHGLREDSRAEAEFVAHTCSRWDLPHEILTLSGLEGPGNLPARARDARYDAISGWANRNSIQTVLLGHTVNDLAETVLMRLARGSGVEGLSGMASGMIWNGVHFKRPLLRTRRDALRDWLRERDLAWVDDPTNDDLSYDRVKAREALGVLEPLGITIEGLVATSDRLARQRKVLESAAEDLTDDAVRIVDGTAVLDRNTLRNAVPDTAMRVHASVLQQIGGNRYRPRFRALQPLYDRIISTDKTTVTLARCLIALQRDHVRITPEQRRESDANRGAADP